MRSHQISKIKEIGIRILLLQAISGNRPKTAL
jgi:hypothetical protein